MTPTPSPSPVTQIAAHVASQRNTLAAQWLRTVHADADIDASDRLTHAQLIDHLPVLFDELCRFLRGRDAALLAGDVRDDAQEHGHHRWEQGYRLEELLRELDVLRRIVLEAVSDALPELDPEIARSGESTARTLIEEFFSVVSRSSVQQFVTEQNEKTTAYLEQLEESNRQLQLSGGRLAELAASRAQLLHSIAREIQHIGNPLAVSVATSERDGHPNLQLVANHHVAELNALVDQLEQYGRLLADRAAPASERFALRPLFDETVHAFAVIAEQRGLALAADFDETLADVTGDRSYVRQILHNLLLHALRHTDRYELRMSFSQADMQRWVIEVSGTGMHIARSRQVAEEPGTDLTPGEAFGIALVKEMVTRLGGSVRTIATEDTNSLCAVTLPFRLGSAP
ncbi:RsbRD N-terminal domain-containing protein [Paraburkholderia sp. CNPSo 3274]|uniref:sensor histidine kinase n=1 Tax=Paraburkholderia sp. CNPSo 3274 TaxID=2940932 RepID=UPI0020B69CE5|nr:RsbRD N-terminal domain-containing protein [Paraburkholderia sp. CNPSo 3274]MCP3707183.1 RsbRD N-terminal domain-containing protein [Paraburkholderia sp. CNPSo 3274]